MTDITSVQPSATQGPTERMRLWRKNNPDKVEEQNRKNRERRKNTQPIESTQLCECGCGLPTMIARYTDNRHGTIKGQPLKLRRGHSLSGSGRRKKDRIKIEDCGHDTPCWLWQLKTDKAGYGRTNLNGKEWLAHRLYYTEHIGRIPEGYVVDHLCSVKNCVNPNHLEAVTPQENEWRAWMKRASLTSDQILSLRKWMQDSLTEEQLNNLWSTYRWHNDGCH